MLAGGMGCGVKIAAEVDHRRYNNYRNIQKIVENVMFFLQI